jgi:hypothetical protein
LLMNVKNDVPQRWYSEKRQGGQKVG